MTSLITRIKNLWRLSEFSPEGFDEPVSDDVHKLEQFLEIKKVQERYDKRPFKQAEIIYKKKPLEKVISDLTNDN